jgi:hypothetical protein
MAIMEGAIREDLELRAPRVMAIINPLKVTITLRLISTAGNRLFCW